MAFKLTIGGLPFQMADFSVQESATPLSAGDSSGQSGTISFSVPRPDPEIQPNHPILLYGSSWMLRREIRLEDSRKGFTLGEVSTQRDVRNSGLIQVTCTSRMGKLNVYNVQAQPFVGTLGDAFAQYLALAGVTTDLLVDPAIATRPVVFPGWHGELWYYLKQIAVGVDCDISLVSGVILLRPIRQRTVTQGRDIERSEESGGGSLAQSIVVNKYNNRPITNELVYPPGGWSESVTTINVNSGETVEEELELSASVSSVNQPVMQTFVSRDHSASSVFTVVGDDGLPIQPSQWDAQGGSLRVEINPDTTSLTVHITAPRGIYNQEGNEIGVYGISLSSDNSTGRYSTLRIIGSGVAFQKEEMRIPTGISDTETSTEVGATIDNPFLSTYDQVVTAGVRAVRAFNGSQRTVTGTVTAVNRRGETGEVVLRTYAEMQTLHQVRTYAQVQSLYAGKTYLQVQTEFNAGIEDRFENQVFGNVAGARVWDEGSRRWYRIRTATITPANVQFEAEDDLNHSDIQDFLQGQTYAQVQLRYNGFSYREVDLMGMR